MFLYTFNLEYFKEKFESLPDRKIAKKALIKQRFFSLKMLCCPRGVWDVVCQPKAWGGNQWKAFLFS